MTCLPTKVRLGRLLCLLLAVTASAAAQQRFGDENGLDITVVQAGSGAVARAGQEVEVHEWTKLESGKLVFSTYDTGQPIRFCLGAGMVIEGFDQTVQGMRVGEIRELAIPPRLSRREAYPAMFGPEDTLLYRIELVSIVSDTCAKLPASHLIRPSRVFDGESMQDGWAVRVVGDRIAAAGPSASMEAQERDRVIDLPGATLLPGLIEGHSHLFLHPYDETEWNDQVLRESEAYRVARATRHAEATLLAGFTTVRDLGTEGAGYADAGLKRAIEEGIVAGPRLLIASRAIVAGGSYGPKGFAPHVNPPLGAQPADGAQLTGVVRDQIGKGADFIKVYADYRWGPGGEARPTFSIEELKTVVETARSSGRPTVAHAATAEGMRRAALAGVETIEHGDGGTREIFELMAERDVALCPTLAAGESILRYGGWNKATDDRPERIVRKAAAFRAALDAGVTMCMGGDAGVYDHGYNALEMELMVEYGMTPLDVLRSATSINARLFHLDGLVGAVKPGLQADLIAVEGDPGRNIKTLREIRLVMQRGELIAGP